MTGFWRFAATWALHPVLAADSSLGASGYTSASAGRLSAGLGAVAQPVRAEDS